MSKNDVTVLVIEDEKPTREALAKALVNRGFAVLQAADGSEGFSLALKRHPEIILLDLMMPKMNGMEVLKSLRQDAWGKTVPVILLTNMPTDDAVIKEIVEEHPTFYLVKSDWKLEDVLHKVEQTLEMM